MSNKDAILSGITNFFAVVVSVFVLQRFYPMYEAIIISVFMMMFLNILYISSIVIHALHQNQELKKLSQINPSAGMPPQNVTGTAQIQTVQESQNVPVQNNQIPTNPVQKQ